MYKKNEFNDKKSTNFNWFDLGQKYINLIRVKNYNEKENEFKETSLYFNSAVLVDSITNQYAREYKIMIFAFTMAKVDIDNRIKNEIRETKNNH